MCVTIYHVGLVLFFFLSNYNTEIFMISNYRGEEFSGLDLLSTLYQRDRLRRFLTDLSSHYPAHLTEFVWFEVGFHDMIENSYNVQINTFY